MPGEAAIVPLQSERLLVALALGSGGARGIAHVGVIKALEDAGIEPDIVTGSSSGAIVAALYAGGRRARELEEIALAPGKSGLVDFAWFGRGWVRASASVPKLFVSHPINGEEYADGGLTSPVPVKLARAMGADVMIAVDVSWFAQARRSAIAVHGNGQELQN